MFLIAGLGNYPKEYQLTRHNIGFMCIDNIAEKYSASFKTESKFKAEVATVNIGIEKVILVKPLTLMNLSGDAIQKIVAFYKIPIENVLIICDDITLDLGKFRWRASGTDGGHNGIKSVINMFGTDKIARLKVGVGPQPQFMKSEVFVLQNFSQEQMSVVNKVVLKSVDAIEDYLANDITFVQNIYNGLNLAE